MRLLFVSVVCVLSTVFAYSQSLTVAAAANLRFALEEIVDAYEKNTGNKINLVFSSSGKLTAQVMNGAPYDVFLSANKNYPQTLHINGFTKSPPKALIKGSLIFCDLKNTEKKAIKTVLENPVIKTIAIANPKTAPYGIAAVEFLKNLGNYDKISGKLVVVESIAQVNQHIDLNTVDAALTSKSLVFSDRLKKDINWTEVDTTIYNPVVQYVVPLKTSGEKEKPVVDFIDFLYGKTALEIFCKFGYYSLNGMP